MGQLPSPINGTEDYLAAIYHRLGQILERLPEPPAQEDTSDVVELREPLVSVDAADLAEPDAHEERLAEPETVELTEPQVRTRPAPRRRAPAKKKES